MASHDPIDLEMVRSRLQSQPLSASQMAAVQVTVEGCHTTVAVDQLFVVEAELLNCSDTVLKSMPPFPVHLSYHWMRPDGTPEVFDGKRTRILPFLTPDERRRFDVLVQAPSKAGRYVLRVALVQEAVQWFDLPPVGVMADYKVEVVAQL
jgi:hypothetical protein